MRYLLAIPLLLAALFSCSQTSSQWSVPRRDGPPFAQTFPDAAVLATTNDVRATRETLWTTPLPETREHHDRLIAVLERTPSIDTDHLLLLTDAVAVPGRLARDAKGNESVQVSIVTGNDGIQIIRTRGKGEFTPVIDQLLTMGMSKLSDPSATNLGRLVGEAQSTETMIALSDHLLETCDSGSSGDLERMLKGIPFDEQRADFATIVLLPRGRLAGERQSIALETLSFDSTKERLMSAVYDSLDEVPVPMLLEHIELLDFDSGRSSVAKAASSRIGPMTGAEMLAMLERFDFDSGKVQAVQAMRTKIAIADFGDVLQIMDASDFESGANQILDLLLASALPASAFPTLTAIDLGAACDAYSFDSGRIETLRKLEPHFQGTLDGESARELLNQFSFDSGKFECLQIFASRMNALPYDEQKLLLSSFDFDSDRERARDLLNR